MGIASDYMSAWKSIANDVVAKTTKDRPKYWDYCCDYANICKIDPFLSNISCLIEHDFIVTAFTDHFRSSVYGKKVTIKVQGFTVSLRSISRPSNWLENLAPSTAKKANTSRSSSAWWKAIDVWTPHPCLNSQYWSQFHSTASKRRYSPLMLSYVLLAA